MANPKTLYLNLEDDVSKIVAKLDRERSSDLVIVFPKKSFIFSDSINLRLLKKQVDMLGKKVSVLTMDTKGQMFAKEAGFELKFLPKTIKASGFSDIRARGAVEKKAVVLPEPVSAEDLGFAPEPEVVKPVVNPAKTSVVAPVVVPPVANSQTKPQRRNPQPRTKTIENNDFLDNYSGPKPGLVRAKAQVKTPAKVPAKTSATAGTVSGGGMRMPAQSDQNWYLPPSDKDLKPHKKKNYRRMLYGLVATTLIVVILLVWIILPSADITVKAKTQSISRDIDIVVSTAATQIDSGSLTVPGQIVSQTKSYNQTFQTIGKKEIGSKAEGRVAIYNLTGSPINLKASTTVLSVGSKNYYFVDDQSDIKTLNSANNDSDASVADIIAEGGGELFNLPAGTRLEITNQAFGSQPQRLYAKTITQVVGGSSRFTSMVTSDDTKAAQEKFEEIALAEIDQSLTDKNMSLVEGAYDLKFDAFSMDKAEGTEEPTFSASAQLSIAGIAFDEAALKIMLRERFSQSIGSNKILQTEDRDTVAYKIQNVDLTTGTMQISLHYESEALPVVDLNSLKSQLAGKTKNEAKEILDSNPDVAESRIIIFPTFQSKLPKLGSKIDIKVE